MRIFGVFILALLLSGCSLGNSGKSYYKDGIENVESGEYALAKTNLEKAIEVNPNKAEYYIDYGLVLIMNEEFDQALIQFDLGILDKNNKVVKENNKRAHRGKGIAYYSQGRYDEALKEFQLAMEINELEKLDEDIQLYMGLCMEKSGMYQEALAHYDAMLKEDKGNIILYGLMGRTKYYIGDLEGALESYNEAIKKDDKSYEYYIEKYGILLSMGDEQGANEVLAYALTIEPKSKIEKYQVGKINYLLGEYTTAIPQLEDAVENGYIEGNYYLGEIYGNQKEHELALNYYKEYYINEISYQVDTIYNQYAVCLINSKEYEEALKVLEKGLEKEDARTKKSLLYLQVSTLEHLGRFQEAYEVGKEYMKEYPEDEEMVREIEFLKTRVSSDNS